MATLFMAKLFYWSGSDNDIIDDCVGSLMKMHDRRPGDHRTATRPTTRTTPTLVGGRCSSSGTSSQPVSTGVGSGKNLLVREKGLEPSRPKAPGPKPGASTNSATRAVSCLLYRLLCRWQNPKASRTRSGRQGLGAGEPEGASPGMRSVHTKRGKQPLDMPGGTDVVLGQRHSPVGCHHHG